MERLYKCSICKERFGSFDDLFRHRVVHRDAYPYFCNRPGCIFMTKYSSNLPKHIRKNCPSTGYVGYDDGAAPHLGGLEEVGGNVAVANLDQVGGNMAEANLDQVGGNMAEANLDQVGGNMAEANLDQVGGNMAEANLDQVGGNMAEANLDQVGGNMAVPADLGEFAAEPGVNAADDADMEIMRGQNSPFVHDPIPVQNLYELDQPFNLVVDEARVPMNERVNLNHMEQAVDVPSLLRVFIIGGNPIKSGQDMIQFAEELIQMESAFKNRGLPIPSARVMLNKWTDCNFANDDTLLNDVNSYVQAHFYKTG